MVDRAPYPYGADYACAWITVGLVGVLVVAICLACAGCGSLQGSYVKADEQTYNAIAPVVSAYVGADPKLDKAQKERVWRLLRSWKARIDEGKRADDIADVTSAGRK